jgi:general secretion pathway protein D
MRAEQDSAVVLRRRRRVIEARAALAALAIGLLPAPGSAQAPPPAAAPPAAAPPAAAPPAALAAPAAAEGQMVNLDFDDVEIAVVIDTIAKLTGKNFIYDDRVRGRVTIVSPTPIPLDQAYTVFESVLQVKGFTTVTSPGGVIKVIPVRDAKESSIDTREGTKLAPISDRFVTRLIPLSYIDAEAISNTLKPLVSKEAALVAYAPTNTVILTDSASNIQRILSIIEAIDVETYKQELAVIRLRYADAGTLSEQLSNIFGGEASATATPARVRRRATPTVQTPQTPREQVNILTDERTNSLIVLASRSTLDEIRNFVRKLDVPVEGGGRIQVYYLKYADAEDLANTLNSLLSGSPAGGQAGGGQPGPGAQVLRAAVVELAGGVTSITADPQTNSLVIQASPEGFEALVKVIERLDIPRPQVLVEGLIMEVDVVDAQALGFTGIVRIFQGDSQYLIQSASSAAQAALLSGATGGMSNLVESGVGKTFLGGFLHQGVQFDENGNPTGNGTVIGGIINAAATDNSTNILSAPHILTSDNEEAEILVGDNIPIITSRVQSAAAAVVDQTQLATSVNVERQDIGVTLRVTPQITEGDSLRLQIFQEITDINSALSATVGDPTQVGVALSNRRIENTVVVNDGDTVVIGGLVSDSYLDGITKVPWLGDIPVLGWLFKSTSKTLTKKNLLVFLTPHIIRSKDDLEKESIRKREEFKRRSEQALGAPEEEEQLPDEAIGVLGSSASDHLNSPAQKAVKSLERRYPLQRMLEIERQQAAAKAAAAAGAASAGPATHYGVLAAVFRDPDQAQALLTQLVDAGYDGALYAGETHGTVLFEIRLGPWEKLEDAQRAADSIRSAYQLSPEVVIQPAEERKEKP